MPTNFIKSEHVSCQTSDKGKGFLFDHGSGYVYLLNKTGCYIFTLLQEGASIEEIIARVSKKFNIDSSVISEDVQNFLSEVEKMKLVVCHD
ncbi:PqqD family protein [Patescibacteria group bacterium]|nr:PqqD family protein [Patescibacteria group bacterium]